MNEFDDKPIDQASYAFRELTGQKPLGFPFGVGTLYFVSGVPSNSIGSNGDYCFRKDGGVGTHLYFKAAAVWGAIV